MQEIKHEYLGDLPESVKRSFGELVRNFEMIVWGQSGNGKSRFVLQFCKEMVAYGPVLYVSLEEGFGASMLRNVNQVFCNDGNGMEFADHNMVFDELVKKLKKRGSARFVIIDSVQYWNITYIDYKNLKEMFPAKTFIFVSHAKGKMPDGKTADRIRYDAGIKVRVEGYVAFVTSRYGGNKPYVIWEEGAAKHWSKAKLKKILA